jgi:hypothetical protein
MLILFLAHDPSETSLFTFRRTYDDAKFQNVSLKQSWRAWSVPHPSLRSIPLIVS